MKTSSKTQLINWTQRKIKDLKSSILQEEELKKIKHHLLDVSDMFFSSLEDDMNKIETRHPFVNYKISFVTHLRLYYPELDIKDEFEDAKIKKVNLYNQKTRNLNLLIECDQWAQKKEEIFLDTIIEKLGITELKDVCKKIISSYKTVKCLAYNKIVSACYFVFLFYEKNGKYFDIEKMKNYENTKKTGLRELSIHASINYNTISGHINNIITMFLNNINEEFKSEFINKENKNVDILTI